MEVRPQSSKAHLSIDVTELGMEIEVRLPQPPKAPSPMQVTEFGIVMAVRPLPEKAPAPMFVTELGMIVFLHPPTNVLEYDSIIALQFSRES